MKVVAVVAHADDEALGCGGTLARHVAEGDSVTVVYMADGVTSRTNLDNGIEERQLASKNAQAILGIHSAYFLGLPDNRLDSLPLLDVVQPLEKIIQKLAPDQVYTHHYGDLNVDHRVTHNAVLTACRPQPGNNIKKIFSFEVMSSTEWNSPGLLPFLPNHFVDISEFIDTKMKALNAYALEMRPSPHSRSYEHLKFLAYHHGLCVGVEAAEAFMIIRYLR